MSMEVVSEKVLERKLTKRLKEVGIWCEKYANPFKAGYPDRLCLVGDGECFWVEVKTTGEKLRPIQTKRVEELWDLGYRVFVVDSYESLEKVIEYGTNRRNALCGKGF